MKICIVGWYGTETLGDRSILIGLARVIEKCFGKSKIYLGSIHPFYTERCLYEDKEFYSKVSPNVEIDVFDIKDMKTYKSVIKNSSIIAMGGGPIMDLYELGAIEFGFGYARKNNVKTAILGCGVGPLYDKTFREVTSHILEMSDLIILRDKLSIIEADNILLENNRTLDNKIIYLHDPAIIPIGIFLNDQKEKTRKVDNNVLINMRAFPSSAFREKKINESILIEMVKGLADKFDKVKLLPMHTFSIGGDDRFYLYKIKQLTNASNIEVINKPLSVYELFETIYEANKCIGMRYHSIVFQTLINGNNAIIDYTEPNKGKISGFLNLIDGLDHYKDMYINLQSENSDVSNFIYNFLKSTQFKTDKDIFIETEQSYVDKVKALV